MKFHKLHFSLTFVVSTLLDLKDIDIKFVAQNKFPLKYTGVHS